MLRPPRDKNAMRIRKNLVNERKVRLMESSNDKVGVSASVWGYLCFKLSTLVLWFNVRTCNFMMAQHDIKFPVAKFLTNLPPAEWPQIVLILHGL